MYVAGPEIQRFSELKVGDKVNATYDESTVYELRKPGDPPLNASARAVTPANSTLPGGTAAKQTMQTVTVKALDPNVPSITVATSDGRTVLRKVGDKARLTGVKVGDQIQPPHRSDARQRRAQVAARRHASDSAPLRYASPPHRTGQCWPDHGRRWSASVNSDPPSRCSSPTRPCAIGSMPEALNKASGSA